MPSVIEEKARLRALCKQMRMDVTPEEKRAWDAALCDVIRSHEAFRLADLVLCFAPVRGEPDLTSLFETARKNGIPLAFPRTTGRNMTFHIVRDTSELSQGRFGIPTPDENAPVAMTTKRTLCIMPGLAATKQGDRLGYGGGFYDRFLANFDGISIFPIYERLILSSLPCEEYDYKPDFILCEKGEAYKHG